MLRPRDTASQDPVDIPINEVSYTAWIEARYLKTYSERVRCDFRWFGANGPHETNVETGPLSSWPTLSDDMGATSGNHVADADETEERDATNTQNSIPIERSRFEQSSPPLKATCDLVRKIACYELCVHVHVPLSGWTPPTPGSELAPLPSEGKPTKAKDKKHVTETVDVSVPEKTHDITLPLAPLLFSNSCQGQCVSIFEDVEIECEGLRSFRVGITCSAPILSDELASYLNPLLVTLDAVYRLPREEHLGQTRDLVFGLVHAFGETCRSKSFSIDAEGNSQIRSHMVFFVGTWHQAQLRDQLQTEHVVVEIHDRDVRDPDPPPMSAGSLISD
eukprot:CAMPEP_0115667906 /NCGR_PEP_ID=MMETSP0272-20121206/50186_1 /TAXON_ID=71861 /ORGANISM="Scrippsiella trochoidea, Strain CCMP3099" /LENGTH=333 /DNA_ID=CAMNT_0003106477 /DNA_START=88 /DNA_END=1086 /DNA_ORIENTATION=+